MEGALSSHRQVRATRVRCRLRCQDQHPLDESFSDLRFFDSVLRRAACMNKCIEEKVGTQSLHKVSEDVVQDFNRRIPYNYLQQAYQKVRRGGGGSCWSWMSAIVADSAGEGLSGRSQRYLLHSSSGRFCCLTTRSRENSRVLFVPVLRNVPHVHGACSGCVIVDTLIHIIVIKGKWKYLEKHHRFKSPDTLYDPRGATWYPTKHTHPEDTERRRSLSCCFATVSQSASIHRCCSGWETQTSKY